MHTAIDKQSIRREIFMDKFRKMDRKEQQQKFSNMQQQQDQQAALRQQALQNSLPPHLAALAAAAVSTPSIPFNSSLLQGRSSIADAATASLLAARDAANHQRQPTSATTAADALFLGELQHLQAAVGGLAGQQVAGSPGLFSTAMLPPSGSNLSVPQDSLLRATPALMQQQAALPNLLGGFVNALYPFGVGSGKRSLSTEQFLDGWQQQLKKQRVLDEFEEAKAAVLGAASASHGCLRKNGSVSLSAGNNFPLPHAKHIRKSKKPSMSSFRQDWNKIKTKAIRKELFLRQLYGKAKVVVKQKTEMKKRG